MHSEWACTAMGMHSGDIAKPVLHSICKQAGWK